MVRRALVLIVVAFVGSAAHGATPDDAARAWITTQPAELTAARTIHPGGGAAIRYAQSYRGVPILDRGVAVRVDDAGNVRWTHATLATIPADFDTTPTIRVDGATLMILPVDPVPRLVWRIEDRQEKLIDAHTGELLGARDRVRYASNAVANVYELNPVTTPSLVQIALDSLPAGATVLSGPDIDAYSCNATKCVSFPSGESLLFCSEERRAHADGWGTFTGILPPASDTDPTDAFAEVQSYYHADKAARAFRVIAGDPSFAIMPQPIHVVANWLDAPDRGMNACTGGVPAASAMLVPFDNAFWTPKGGLGGGLPTTPIIVVGQGTKIDLSLDGDVLYHEFTHAVQFQGGSWSYYFPDARGADDSPGSLAEGYADYFSSTVTGDPDVAEYFANSLGLPYLRSLSSDYHCPDHLSGEGHGDSPIWTGALWEMREQLSAADQATFDHAVFVAFLMVDGSTDFAAAAEMTLAEIAVDLPSAHDRLAAIFARRGLTASCRERVVDLPDGASRDMILEAAGWLALHRGRAVMQFRVTLDAPAHALDLAIARAALSGSATFTPPALEVLVKGGAPITWSGDASDEQLAAPVTFDTGTFGNPGHASVGGDFQPGVYYVQLAATGNPDVGLQGITVSFEPGAGPPDAGIVADATIPETGGGGGCGCTAGGRRPAPPAGAILILLCALALRRRG
jgi:hypothetical protein